MTDTATKTETRVIWAYRIPVNVLAASFTTVHHIPEGARRLHCAPQKNGIALWYEVPDPEAPKKQRGFQIYGTGIGPIRDGLEYCGTCQFHDGELVLHVYEVSDP